MRTEARVPSRRGLELSTVIAYGRSYCDATAPPPSRSTLGNRTLVSGWGTTGLRVMHEEQIVTIS
jgi:hypothetical protein